MRSPDPTTALVRWTLRLEDASGLDRPVQALEPHIREAFGSGRWGAFLRGDWLGHALHPLLTDFVIGSWTSANVLDVIGDAESSSSARRLIGLGLLAAAPTAWSGWAEWSNSEPRDKRVGLVHAATNGVVIGLYASSYVARRRGREDTGVRLGFAGAAVSSVGAYLGGHLAQARNVGSRHPAFDPALQAV